MLAREKPSERRKRSPLRLAVRAKNKKAVVTIRNQRNAINITRATAPIFMFSGSSINAKSILVNNVG